MGIPPPQTVIHMPRQQQHYHRSYLGTPSHIYYYYRPVTGWREKVKPVAPPPSLKAASYTPLHCPLGRHVPSHAPSHTRAWREAAYAVVQRPLVSKQASGQVLCLDHGQLEGVAAECGVEVGVDGPAVKCKGCRGEAAGGLCVGVGRAGREQPVPSPQVSKLMLVGWK